MLWKCEEKAFSVNGKSICSIIQWNWYRFVSDLFRKFSLLIISRLVEKDFPALGLNFNWILPRKVLQLFKKDLMTLVTVLSQHQYDNSFKGFLSFDGIFNSSFELCSFLPLEVDKLKWRSCKKSDIALLLLSMVKKKNENSS